METTPKEWVDFLSEYITPNRKALFDKNIVNRTRYITVVLEDIFQAQNASAVLRTCDCFGIQDIHVIEKRNEYKISIDVSLGSENWINIYKHDKPNTNNTIEAINNLKSKGYKIVATTPHTNDTLLPEYDLTQGKFALLFGTELTGLSKDAMELSDSYLRIPMYGFTESFNISVSAAITLYDLTTRLRKSNINWQLSEEEKYIIVLEWIKKSMRYPEKMMAEYERRKKLNI